MFVFLIFVTLSVCGRADVYILWVCEYVCECVSECVYACLCVLVCMYVFECMCVCMCKCNVYLVSMCVCACAPNMTHHHLDLDTGSFVRNTNAVPPFRRRMVDFSRAHAQVK